VSTLTLARLQAWDATSLASLASGLRQQAEVLRVVEVIVRRAVAAIEIERGASAEAQRQQGLAHARLARRVADTAELDAGVVQAASEVVAAAADLLSRAVRLAEDAGLRIAEDGRVDPGPLPDDERASLAATCSALARQALAAAEEGDADAARSLLDREGMRGVRTILFGPVPYDAALIASAAAAVAERALPATATVAERTGWWEATPRSEQRRLIAAGDIVGGATGEGLPSQVRDAVNRARLSAELADVQSRLAGAGWWPSSTELVDRRRLGVLSSIRDALELPGTRLLSFDSTTGSGRAVVAVGDVDRADHVAVLVPGLTGWVSGSLGDLVRSAQRVRDQAELYGPGSVAAVAWIGYQAPGWHDVALAGSAERGVAGLRQTLEALQVRADVQGQEQSVALLGHSYGSLLSGLATRDPTGLDDLVLLGSPGTGARHVSELAVPARHVWVGEGRFDQVADLGRFGVDPSLRQFGAVTLPTAAGRDPVLGTPVSVPFWHLQYYAAGSASLASIGLVVAGRGGLLRPGSLAPGPFRRPQVSPAVARAAAPRTPR